MSGTDFKIESAKESSNVKDCSTPEDEGEEDDSDNSIDDFPRNRRCTSDTCKNGGYCNQLNDNDYNCECRMGFR